MMGPSMLTGDLSLIATVCASGLCLCSFADACPFQKTEDKKKNQKRCKRVTGLLEPVLDAQMDSPDC